MSPAYAKNTTVPVSKSRETIARLIERFAINNLATGLIAGRDFVMFDHDGQTYRFMIEPEDDEREKMRKWRCLVLYVRSALVVIDEGVREFDTVFLADRVLPNGRSWGDYAKDTNNLPRTSAFPQLETDRER